MPPHEALAKAAQRIDVILQQDRHSASEETPVLRDEAPKDHGEVTFWFFAHPAFSPMLLPRAERLAEFSAAHPGVRLKPQFIGDWSIAIQKLTVSLAAGDLPDIALVKRGWLARLAPSGLIVPLDDLLPSALLEDLRSPARESTTLNGRLYALPADGFCSVLYYNQDTLKGPPPATWDDLRRCARELPVPEDASANAVYAIGDLPFIETLWSAGGEVCSARTSGLAAPQAQEALDFVLALRAEKLAHPRAWGNPAAGMELFLRGKIAMTVASSEYLSRIREASFPVGVAPVPGKSGPISMLSDNAIVVFGRYAQAKRDALADALDFLTGPAFQAAGSVPIRASVARDAAVPKGIEDAFAHARNTPLTPAWGAVEFELNRYLDLAYRWSPTQ